MYNNKIYATLLKTKYVCRMVFLHIMNFCGDILFELRGNSLWVTLSYVVFKNIFTYFSIIFNLH